MRKAHVIEKRWTVSGFMVERHILCRCGWRAEHYNAGHLTELFKQHQAEADGVPMQPVSPPSGGLPTEATRELAQ